MRAGCRWGCIAGETRGTHHVRKVIDMKVWISQLIAAASLLLCVSVQAIAQQPEEEPSSSPAGTDPWSVELNFTGHVRPIAVWETVDFGELGPPPRNRGLRQAR